MRDESTAMSNLRLFQRVSYITDIKNYNGGSSEVHLRSVHLMIAFIILTTTRDSVSINHKLPQCNKDYPVTRYKTSNLYRYDGLIILLSCPLFMHLLF